MPFSRIVICPDPAYAGSLDRPPWMSRLMDPWASGEVLRPVRATYSDPRGRLGVRRAVPATFVKAVS
jgi:hypothetical protein